MAEPKLARPVPEPYDAESAAAQPLLHAGPFVTVNNAKFLMMVLVIMTHLQTQQLPGHETVLSTINPFQARTLCFISGMLSQKAYSKDSMRKLIVATVVPLLSYCFLLHPLLFPLLRGQWPGATSEYLQNVGKLLFSSGSELHWYLFALFWWRLFHLTTETQLFPFRIIVAFMLAAAFSYRYVALFSLTESFSCLPIFVVGQRTKGVILNEGRRHGERRNTWSDIFLGGTSFLVLHALTTYTGLNKQYPFSVSSFPGATHQAIPVNGGVVGNYLWVLGGCAGIGLMIMKIQVFLMSCCPRSRYTWSDLGQHSIYPYLLHQGMALPFHAKLQTYLVRSGYMLGSDKVMLLWLAELAFCFTSVVVLSSKPVRVLFQPLLSPYGSP